MPDRWSIDWNRDPRDRRRLAERVLAQLLQHEHVASADLFGSLASPEPDGYPADALSAIDIGVTLRSGTDRDLVEALEPMLAELGHVLLYNIVVSDGSFTGSYVFEGYSPFWHVDVVCRAPRHVPGEDLLDRHRSERAFGAWLSAAKRFARAGEFLGYFLALAPDADAAAHHQPARLFGALLEQWHRESHDDLRLEIGRSVVAHLFSPERG
ncbi:MAG TPA: hypothetical protein VF230_10225 [Acidimicrobiales bacterium]